LHEFLAAFRHTVTDAGLGRKQCGTGADWESVSCGSGAGGSGQKVSASAGL